MATLSSFAKKIDRMHLVWKLPVHCAVHEIAKHLYSIPRVQYTFHRYGAAKEKLEIQKSIEIVKLFSGNDSNGQTF